MNLTEYRDSKAKVEYLRGDFPVNMEQALIHGFDAAIALDLPEKFTKWVHQNDYHFSMNTGEEGGYLTTEEILNEGDYDKRVKLRRPFKELYQYWIDNVLKLE